LASINKNGAFLAGGNSLEARQFALSFADALSYANADPSKVAIIRATIRRDALSSFDFSRNIDPFIFRNGVVTVQPGTQTDIFNRALLSIDQAL
jgi:filamentous hemagglutinin